MTGIDAGRTSANELDSAQDLDLWLDRSIVARSADERASERARGRANVRKGERASLDRRVIRRNRTTKGKKERENKRSTKKVQEEVAISK